MSDDDLDFMVDLDGLDDPDSTRVAGGVEQGSGIFIFETESDQATEALKRTGLKAQRATMGSEMMAAAQKQNLQAVFIAPNTDPELRELFMRAFRGKFPQVPVVYLSEQFNDPKEQAQYRYEGATIAMPWPLPPAKEILDAVAQLVGAPIQVDAALEVQPGSDREKDEIALLKRKVAAIEDQRRPSPEVERALEREKERAQSKAKEATSLRSELTLIRERSQMLQDRIDRSVGDLAAITQERDKLKLHLRKLKAKEDTGTSGGSGNAETVKSLRKIGQSADSFVWGLEQAIQFFEELQFEAGDSRSPSLKGHLRSLKLVRALLERIRDRLHEL